MKILSLFIAILLLAGLCACSYSPARETVVTDDGKHEDMPAQEDDGLTPIYDNTAVVEAYRSGDTSKLDKKQLAIYNAAINAIVEFYSDGMSDEDIVIAVHDWLVVNMTYDTNMLLPILSHQTKDSENPYGALIKGQAICMGYTTTFQLFMDMLGIESVIVRGSNGVEEHAWNMVRLDDEWYHVDVTWDDFVPDEKGRPAFHIYTLVPDYVMGSDHIWDRSTAPTATADDRIYYKTHGLYAETEAENAAILEAAKNSGQKYAEIMTPSESEVTNYLYTYWVNRFGYFSEINRYVVTIYWLTD